MAYVKDYVLNTRKDAEQYINGEKIGIALDTAQGMVERGWKYHSYAGCKGAYSATWMKGARTMQYCVRSEWRKGEDPEVKAFVDRVTVKHATDPKKYIDIPVDGEYMAHVWRSDPLATASALDLCTDEELWEQYSGEARVSALDRALRSEVADILKELK